MEEYNLREFLSLHLSFCSCPLSQFVFKKLNTFLANKPVPFFFLNFFPPLCVLLLLLNETILFCCIGMEMHLFHLLLHFLFFEWIHIDATGGRETLESHHFNFFRL